MVDRIVRFPEVKAMRGEGRSTIYNRIREGLFPPPLRLGPRMAGWRESELATINAAIIRGASEDEIRQLVTTLVADRAKAA